MKKKIIGNLIMMLLLVTSTIPLVTASIGNGNNHNEDESKDDFVLNDVKHYVLDNKYITNQIIESDINNDNLLTNPSFEDGNGNLPDGWDHDPIYHEEVYIWDNTQSFSGEKSIAITNLNELEQHTRWHSDLIPVDLLNNRYVFYTFYKYIGHPSSNQYGLIGYTCYDENRECFVRCLWDLPVSYEWRCIWKIHLNEWTNNYEQRNTKYISIDLCFLGGWSAPNHAVEIRFDDVYFGLEENHPPLTPIINGPISNKIQTEIQYNITIKDPDPDILSVYVDWGDGTNSTLSSTYVCPNVPRNVSFNHTWGKKGNYVIKAKVKDAESAESEWAILEVSMPKNKTTNTPFLKFLENHPHMFSLLRYMMHNGII